MSIRFSGSMTVPVQKQHEGSSGTSVAIGLLPLLVLLVAVGVTTLAVAITHQLVLTSDFFTQQRVALIVLISGLALGTLVYIGVLIRTLRWIAGWQARGDMRARAALLVLLANALIVALPVVLAIVLPQSPAP